MADVSEHFIIETLLRDPNKWMSGYELSVEAPLSVADLYPALRRLENAGKVKSAWETSLPPRRRLYRLIRE